MRELENKLDRIIKLLENLQTPVKQEVQYKYDKNGNISKIIKSRTNDITKLNF